MVMTGIIGMSVAGVDTDLGAIEVDIIVMQALPRRVGGRGYLDGRSGIVAPENTRVGTVLPGHSGQRLNCARAQ